MQMNFHRKLPIPQEVKAEFPLTERMTQVKEDQGVGEHTYGKSITDPCLGWEKTERLILGLAEKL